MKFPRTKKLVFCNNKGGVGKTTLAFNVASYFANLGYKTLLVDLDPQCNLTLQTLGMEFFEENLFVKTKKTIYDVVKGFVEGETGIDLDVPFVATPNNKNLFIVPGDMNLVYFEEMIPSALGDAARGAPRGFLITSAIDRYLNKRCIENEIDMVVIDTSPNLGALNQVTFLGADFFVVPATPDIFSVQGIENLGKVFAKWRETWKLSAKAVAKGEDKIPASNVLSGDALFAGYIINSYHFYMQPIKTHRNWMEEIKKKVSQFLSQKHCKNGLVVSTTEQLANIKDYGKIASLSQEKHIPMFDLKESDLGKIGTIENWERSKTEFKVLAQNLLEVLKNY